jgi:hypothetical protein
VFDLELPTSFVPKNNDGEVDGFELVPIDKVAEKISSYEFKTTSCSIAIDFLIRHGVVNAENGEDCRKDVSTHSYYGSDFTCVVVVVVCFLPSGGAMDSVVSGCFCVSIIARPCGPAMAIGN